MVRLGKVNNEVTSGEQFPEGEYEFELAECGVWVPDKPGPYDDPDRVQLVWKFRAVAVLDADDGAEAMIGKTIWRFSGDTMGVRQDGTPTIARETAQALLGRALEPGEEPDTDDLIGMRARGEVGRTVNGKHKVTRMRRLSRREPVAKAAPAKRGGTAVAERDDDPDPWDQDE